MRGSTRRSLHESWPSHKWTLLWLSLHLSWPMQRWKLLFAVAHAQVPCSSSVRVFEHGTTLTHKCRPSPPIRARIVHQRASARYCQRSLSTVSEPVAVAVFNDFWAAGLVRGSRRLPPGFWHGGFC